MRKYILLSILFFCAGQVTVLAQTLKSDTLFYDNFGAPGLDVQTRKIWPWMPTDVETFLFADPNAPDIPGQSGTDQAKNIENNFYAVVSPKWIYKSVSSDYSSSWEIWGAGMGGVKLTDIGDATPKHEGNGGALIINAGTTLAAFYVRLGENLKPGKYYKLSYKLWVQHGDVKIDHHITIPDVTSSVGVYSSPENGQGSGTRAWKEQVYWFYMPPTCSGGDYSISVRNANSNDSGNDYAIDDLLFEEYNEKPSDIVIPTSANLVCAEDLKAPIADDDEKLNNDRSLNNGIIVVPFLDGDFDATGNPATSNNVDVNLLVPIGAHKDQWSPIITVPGEGVWTFLNGVWVNGVQIWGLQFTPLASFLGNPTPLYYTITDKSTKTTSNRAKVTVTYLNVPVTNDDEATMTPGSFVDIDILKNDKKGNKETPEPSDVSVELINPYNPLQEGLTSFYIPDQGTWSYDSSTGKLRFTPQEGFKGEPTPIKYIIKENGNRSYPATVTIKTIQSSPQNYWHGTTDTDWSKPQNWTNNSVPGYAEDIVFATEDNNGSAGNGNGKGAAINDLYLDQDRTIGSLINHSDVNLVVTTENQLIIEGTVQDNNTAKGTIVVKSDKEKATGTLLFSNPSANTSVNATVEFINNAYECATCGFYKKQWQYFGIPVNTSNFPYQNPKEETIHQWVESYNGNKWRPAPYLPDLTLKAFTGYEITNNLNTEPTHVYDFSGILNVGDANVSSTKSLNVNYSGMNLIANSFTAAIPITSAAIDLTNIQLKDNTLYLFNMGTRDEWRKLNGGSKYGVAAGQYQSVPIDLAGQAGIPDRILSMHTFMLDVTTPGYITLHYDQLLKNELNLSTTKPWKSTLIKNSRVRLPYIVMDVIGSESADRVWLFEQANTTTGFDNGWDGYKIKEGELIQTYVLGDDESDYQIATVPQVDGTIIGVKTNTEEGYSINLSVAPEIEKRNLYLLDLLTGRSYPIVNNGEYLISSFKNSKNDRFKIASNSTSPIRQDDKSSLIDIYVKNNNIIVENLTGENCIATVYDLAGRQLMQKRIKDNEVGEFSNISKRETGIYVVKAITETRTIQKSDRFLLKY